MEKKKNATRIPIKLRVLPIDPVKYEKWSFIGIGGCGCRILAKLQGGWFSHSYKKKSKLSTEDVLAIDASRYDLSLLMLNRKNMVQIGENRNSGFGGDRKEAKEFIKSELGKNDSEVMNRLKKSRFVNSDACLLITSLGGATGSGGNQILSEKIKNVFKEENINIPLVTLGILPFYWEAHLFHDNSIKAIEDFGESSNSNHSSDLLIMVDNSILHERKKIRYVNEKIAEIIYRITTPKTFPYGKMLDVIDIIRYTKAEGKNVIFPALYYPKMKDKEKIKTSDEFISATKNEVEFVKGVFKDSAMFIFPEKERAKEVIKNVLVYLYIPERLSGIVERDAPGIVDIFREKLEGLNPTVFFLPALERKISVFTLCTVDLDYIKEGYKNCWYSGKTFEKVQEEREKAIDEFFK